MNEQLHETIEQLATRVNTLERFTDKNDLNLREEMAQLKLIVGSLKIIISGSENLRLKGLVERTENMEKLLVEIAEVERKKENRLEGMMVILKIVGMTTGVGTLGVLAQLLKLLE